MPNNRWTRRQILRRSAPLIVGGPLVAAAAAGAASTDLGARHGHDAQAGVGSALGHGAMVGEGVPAVGGPNDLDALLLPPPALAGEPGRVREYRLVASDRDIEIAPGITFPAWTYNGTVPGPIIRATEGDTLRVLFANGSVHPHTIHFHGTHPSGMDGVFEVVEPGGSFTYEFEARPAGMHVYHCHTAPLKKHIHKGLYGAFIIDPATPRAPAQELVMVMNGFDTDGDGENNLYTVNGRSFYYARYPIRVRRSETVRIYLANLTEFDLINSFHLHGEVFRWHPTGTSTWHELTDTVMLCQGQRGILEIDFANTGLFMFHAHQSEFTDLGWMGFFEVLD